MSGTEPQSWRDLALCRGIVGRRKPSGDADDPMFDAYENSQDTARAVDSMCGVCPVRPNCLIYGIENKEQGVWGGFYLMNGRPDAIKNGHKTDSQWGELKELVEYSNSH